MIVPNVPVVRIIIFIIVGAFFPWKSYRDIKILQQHSDENCKKWVKTKTIQAVLALVSGLIGLAGEVIYRQNTDAIYWLAGLGFTTLLAAGFIEDNYSKFRKNCNFSGVMMTEVEKATEERNRLTPARWIAIGVLFIFGLLIAYFTLHLR